MLCDATGVLRTACRLHQPASQVVVAVDGVVDQLGAEQLSCQAHRAPVLPKAVKVMPQQEPSADNMHRRLSPTSMLCTAVHLVACIAGNVRKCAQSSDTHRSGSRPINIVFEVVTEHGEECGRHSMKFH